MKISTFDRPSLKVLRASIEEALRVVSEKHGIAVRTGSISFGASQCKVAVECTTISADGKAFSPEAEELRRSGHFFGVKPEWLDKSFVAMDGKTYILRGLATKGRKNICLIDGEGGKRYRAPASMVQWGFRNETPASPAG